MGEDGAGGKEEAAGSSKRLSKKPKLRVGRVGDIVKGAERLKREKNHKRKNLEDFCAARKTGGNLGAEREKVVWEKEGGGRSEPHYI